jgi:hypothetical protein
MAKIDTKSADFKKLSTLEQARLIWRGMKKLNPESCKRAQASVKKNMINAGFYSHLN